MNAARIAPLLLAVLCLSACATGPSSSDAVGRLPVAGGASGGDAPLAWLPTAAGRVVAVRRIAYSNGVGQEIVLDGPRAMLGENRITVDRLTSARAGGRGQIGEELKLGPPGDVEIMSEMARHLPGLTMHVAPGPVRGAAGPIGYATGTAGRLACVYAWQYVAPPRPVSLFEGLTDTGVLPVSIRVRLCREQRVGDLVDALRGLTLAGPEGGAGPTGGRATGDVLDAVLNPMALSDRARARPAVDREAWPQHRRRQPRSTASPRLRHPAAGQRGPGLRHTAGRRMIEPIDDLRRAPVPRLPMPGDEAVGGAAASRVSVLAPTLGRAPATGDDSLPMPQ